jgi:hypothetical protein
MILPTFRIVKCVLGLMILEKLNRRNIPRTVRLVETYKVAALFCEKLSLQIFTKRDH